MLVVVTLFTSPSCTSCRKAKAWLIENGIDFVERNIFSEALTTNEIKEDEIRRFLPKEIRVNQLKQIKNMVK